MFEYNTAKIDALLARRPELAVISQAIYHAAGELVALYRERSGTLFMAGNGGSAADCDHIAGELLKGFKNLRPLSPAVRERYEKEFGEDGLRLSKSLQQGLSAVSLLSHPGLLSAFANDVNADMIFAQQLQALAKPGDVFLGISTGGNAANIRYALMTAKITGLKTILLTGNRHGICEKYADIIVPVPESETYLIQENHIAIYHAWCLSIEENLFC